MKAIVLCDNTLQGLGLKYLLDKFFDIPVTIVHDAGDVDAGAIARDMLIVATPRCVASAIDFFMPRRAQTLLLASEPVRGSDFSVVYASSDESSMIEALRCMVDRLRCVGVTETPAVGLTQREIDVLRLVALGYINKEIADELSISINTVLSHRKNIIAKLGIRSASGWSFYAMMNGLIDSSQVRR